MPLTRRFAPHRLVRWLQAEPQLGVQAWAGKQASPLPPPTRPHSPAHRLRAAKPVQRAGRPASRLGPAKAPCLPYLVTTLPSLLRALTTIPPGWHLMAPRQIHFIPQTPRPPIWTY